MGTAAGSDELKEVFMLSTPVSTPDDSIDNNGNSYIACSYAHVKYCHKYVFKVAHILPSLWLSISSFISSASSSDRVLSSRNEETVEFSFWSIPRSLSLRSTVYSAFVLNERPLFLWYCNTKIKADKKSVT